MSVVGFFSGIGGFELAFAEAGFETRLLVENDPAAIAVLKVRFPTVEFHRDVLSLTGIPSDATVLTAGFPCQNLSMAGDKAGISGSKSSIVTKMFGLIEQSRVSSVVIENVYFMLQLDSGRAMEWMVNRFQQLGYMWAYRVLNSMGFGLPQRRRRVYFVASREFDPRTVLFADDRPSIVPSEPDLQKPLGFYWTEGRSGIGLTTDGIPPLKIGSSLGIPSAPAVLFPDGEVLMPSLRACERLQGFAPDWTEAATRQEWKRDPRWRLVGNAVSVPVARWVAERIRTPGRVLSFTRVSGQTRRPWPDAAWDIGKGRVGVVASDQPILVERPSVTAFRDSTWSRLSDRALNGFITRAAKGGLWTPDGFLDALRTATRKAITSTERQSTSARPSVAHSYK